MTADIITFGQKTVGWMTASRITVGWIKAVPITIGQMTVRLTISWTLYRYV